MAWSIELQADKIIEEKDLEDVVNALPMNLQSSNGITKAAQHPGGWNATTDISKPQGKSVKVSGGYATAGRYSSLMAETLRDRLEVKGYRVTVGTMKDDAASTQSSLLVNPSLTVPSKSKIILDF